MDRITVMSWLEGLTDPDWSHFHSDSEVQNIALEALSLLKEDCHNCKLECLLGRYDQLKEKYDALLKEQEAKYPVCEKCGKEIDHINTSVFNYDGSDSDYSIPITYSKENGCVSFSTSQKWTGYDLTDEEQKEGIRCPYCGKFPFDDSIEIEFYEPVKVMMWTSEGR